MYHDNRYEDILTNASPAAHLVIGDMYIGVWRITVVEPVCQAPYPGYTFIEVVTLEEG
jgi:hypothetical protein